VLVGPQSKVQSRKTNRDCKNTSWLCETEPAVDLPLQFNFGSPYSSSLIVFFDFETKSNDLQEPRRIKTRDQNQRELGPSY